MINIVVMRSFIVNNTNITQIHICKNCNHLKNQHRDEPNGPRFYDHHCLLCKCEQFTKA